MHDPPFRRLVPGYEAPVNLFFSVGNRSAAVRIPMYAKDPVKQRIEFRPPDATCNVYLALAAQLMAGLDGIQNKIEPGKPLDQDIYDLSARDLEGIPTAPMSLDHALDSLEADHEWLTKGDVFTEDFIAVFIDYKRREEVDVMRQRPHPMEFELYHNC